MRSGPGPWLSTGSTNLAIAAIAGLLIWLVGIGSFLLIQLPIVIVAATLGLWLFYVQHQFENKCWKQAENWKFQEVALPGSSHYVLPMVLRWFSGNIGVHHVHHLASRVPYYRLQNVLDDHPDLAAIGRVSIRESFRNTRLVL